MILSDTNTVLVY